MNNDWVMTFTFDLDPSMETMDLWENKLAARDGLVARIPGRGVDVTVFESGQVVMFDAFAKMAGEVSSVVGADPIGAEILSEAEWQRRAEAPTMPELMSAAEIADELGVSRQRVHQLRSTAAFPAPLADLRGGAVWDAAAIRKFNEEWERKPGRPRGEIVISLDREHRPHVTLRQLALPDIEVVPRHIDAVPDLVVIDDDGRVVAIAETKGSNMRVVVPNEAGGWDVKKPGASRASAHYERQSEAIHRARQILQNSGGGELRIHGRDGQIRDSDTIAAGS